MYFNDLIRSIHATEREFQKSSCVLKYMYLNVWKMYGFKRQLSMDSACFSHYKDETPPCQQPSLLISFPGSWVSDAGRANDLTLCCPQPTEPNVVMDHVCCLVVLVCLEKRSGWQNPARSLWISMFDTSVFFPHNILNCPFLILRFIVSSTHIHWKHVETCAKINNKVVVWKDANGALILPVHQPGGLNWNVPPSLPTWCSRVYINDKWQQASSSSSRLPSYIMNHEFVRPEPACAAVPAKQRLGLGASGPQ